MIIPLIAAEASQNPFVRTASEISLQFGLNAWGFFCQVVSFSIVTFLLVKFAYNPILAVLEERRKRIEDGLQNAKKSEVQLVEARKAAEEISTKANEDAMRMIEEARAAAKQVAEREHRLALQLAAEIVAKAREAGEIEQRRLMAELKKEFSRLIVDTTAKVTGKVLTDADRKQITEGANRELAA